MEGPVEAHDAGFPRELHRVSDPYVGARRSKTKDDLSRFDDPLAVSAGEAGDISGNVYRELDGFARQQVNALKTDQTLHRAHH